MSQDLRDFILEQREPLMPMSRVEEAVEQVFERNFYSYSFRLTTPVQRELDITVLPHQVVVVASKNERQGNEDGAKQLKPLTLSCHLSLPDDSCLDSIKVGLERDNLSITLSRDRDLRQPGRMLFVQAD